MNNNFYKTKDQFIASTAYALGSKIIATEWKGSECFFIFVDFNKCKELEGKYYAGELRVNPRLLFDAFKAIKSIIFNKAI